MENEGKKLYSVGSASRTLDVSRSKIYDLMKAGTLAYIMIDSDRRIPASEIERLSREGTATPEQAT